MGSGGREDASESLAVGVIGTGTGVEVCGRLCLTMRAVVALPAPARVVSATCSGGTISAARR